jgi:hypothetical protein
MLFSSLTISAAYLVPYFTRSMCSWGRFAAHDFSMNVALSRGWHLYFSPCWDPLCGQGGA